jgi:hypothetical protein
VSILDGTDRDEITRHRCPVPRAHDRRRRIGSRFACSCGTSYRLECTRFGFMWLPIVSAAPVRASARGKRPHRLATFDYFVDADR